MSRYNSILRNVKRAQANPRGEYERNKRIANRAMDGLSDRPGQLPRGALNRVEGYIADNAPLDDRVGPTLDNLKRMEQQEAAQDRLLAKLKGVGRYAGVGAASGLAGTALSRLLLSKGDGSEEALRRRRRLSALLGLGSAGLGMGAYHMLKENQANTPGPLLQGYYDDLARGRVGGSVPETAESLEDLHDAHVQAYERSQANPDAHVQAYERHQAARARRIGQLKNVGRYAGVGAASGLAGTALSRLLLSKGDGSEEALRRRRRLSALLGLGSAGLGMGAYHMLSKAGQEAAPRLSPESIELIEHEMRSDVIRKRRRRLAALLGLSAAGIGIGAGGYHLGRSRK